MAQYYIDPTVSVSGSGTPTSPFKGWSDLPSRVTGDEVYFKCGTTYVASGVLYINWSGGGESSRAKVGAYYLDGTNPVHGVNGAGRPVISGNDWTVPSYSAFAGLITLLGNRNYVTIQDLEIYRSGRHGILFDGDNGVSTSPQYGIINNVKVNHTNGMGILINKCPYNYNIIERCEVTKWSRDYDEGMSSDWGAGIVSTNSRYSNCTIRKCYVHEGWGESITSGRVVANSAYDHCGYATIEDNVVYRSRRVSIYVQRTEHNTIRRNLLIGTDHQDFSNVFADGRYWNQFGVWLNSETLGDSIPSALNYNYVYNNVIIGLYRGMGMATENQLGTYTDNKFFNNTLIANKSNLSISSSLENCTLSGIEFANNVSICPAGDDSMDHSQNYEWYATKTGLSFHHNSWADPESVSNMAGTGDVETDNNWSRLSGFQDISLPTGVTIGDCSPTTGCSAVDSGTNFGSPYNLGIDSLSTHYTVSPALDISVSTVQNLDDMGAVPLLSAAYYIDPSVSSSGAGTPTSPFKSWADLPSLDPSSRVYFKCGTTYVASGYLNLNWSGTSGLPVVIGAYYLDGVSPVHGVNGEGRPIISGSNFTVPPHDGYKGLLTILGNREYITIENLELLQSGDAGIYVEGDLTEAGSPSHITVQNVYVNQSYGQGILFSKSPSVNALVEKCEVYNHNKKYYLTGANWGGGIVVARCPTSNSTVRKCYIHEGWGEGIIAWTSYASHNAGYVTIEDNIIWNNRRVNIYIDGTNYNIVRRNLCVGAGASTVGPYSSTYQQGRNWNQVGLWLNAEGDYSGDSSPNNNTIYNNVFIGLYMGITFGQASELTYANNNKFYNNTLIANRYNLCMFSNWENIDTSGCEFKNNVSICPADSISIDVNTNDTWIASKFAFSNNSWQSQPSSWAGSGDVQSDNNWAKISGWQDMSSVAGFDIGLCRPIANCSAIDAATDLGSPYNLGIDYTSSSYDIGPPLAIEVETVLNDSDLGAMAAQLSEPPTHSYVGAYNSSGKPPTTPSSTVGFVADRTYLRKWVATTGGDVYSVRFWVSDEWTSLSDWVAVYKDTGGTNLSLMGLAAIDSPGALSDWTGEYVVTASPGGNGLGFEANDILYYGFVVNPSVRCETGKELSGDPLYYATVTIAEGPQQSIGAVDVNVSGSCYDMPFVLGYTPTSMEVFGTATVTAGGDLTSAGQKSSPGAVAVSAPGIVVVSAQTARNFTATVAAGTVIQLLTTPSRSGEGLVTAGVAVVCAGSASKPQSVTIWATPGLSVVGAVSKVGTAAVSKVPAIITLFSTTRLGTAEASAGGSVSAVGTISGISPLRSFVYLVGSITELSLVGSLEETISLLGGLNVTEVNQDFTMYSGDSKSLLISVAGQDLSGSTIIFQAARSINESALITKSTGSGIQVTGAGNSVISISLDSEDTANLVGKYYFEVQVTGATGKVSTVTVGRIKILQDFIT